VSYAYTVRGGFGLYPTDSCYDPGRSSWIPYWFDTLTEGSCLTARDSPVVAGILQKIPGLRYLAVPSYGPLDDSNALRTATAPGLPVDYNPDTGTAGTTATAPPSISYADAIKKAMTDAGSSPDDPSGGGDPTAGSGIPAWVWIAGAALGGLALARSL
jgi:hypothetical protein